MNLCKIGLSLAVLSLAVSTASAEEASSRWPGAVYSRPLTMPEGLVHAGTDIVSNNDFSAVMSKLIAGYGISDKIDIMGFYGFALEEFEAKGDLDINIGYAAIRGAAGGKLEVVPRAQFGYSPLAEGMRPLALGAQVAYNVTDKIQILSPGQQLSVALEEDAAMATPITLGLPVSVAMQVTPQLFVQLDAKLASISVADSENAFIFSDTTPMMLMGTYNVMPALDLAAGLSLDLTPPDPIELGDTLTFMVGVRYFGGAM